jgi:hypothetical protein
MVMEAELGVRQACAKVPFRSLQQAVPFAQGQFQRTSRRGAHPQAFGPPQRRARSQRITELAVQWMRCLLR